MRTKALSLGVLLGFAVIGFTVPARAQSTKVTAPSGWVPKSVAYVKASNTAKSAQFGEWVALSGDGNTMAVGAIKAVQEAGLRVPEDIAVVGYNDIPLASRLIPGLTTVHVPIHEFGSAAARLLLEQIETGRVTPSQVVYAPQLVVRGSTVAGADQRAGIQVATHARGE